MRVETWAIFFLASSAIPAGPEAAELVPPAMLEGYYADVDNSAAFADRALHYLNELSARRRLTNVFPNEQSPFYGVQLNYVNVREGNLTFLMRDMVRGARIPIVFGRVYDSRKQDESDFGVGWKLSVAESLELNGDVLLYTDASNSTYLLTTDGTRIRSGYPHLTGISGGSLDRGGATIRIGTLTKVFRRRGDSFRFAEVRDQFNNWLRFNYVDGFVVRILSSTGRYVDVVRDGTTRIVGARDDAGRSTRYTYDTAGRLVRSFGIDGGVTEYRYADAGLLSEVVDPRGFQSIAARYQPDGKVAAVDSQHDKMSYEFGANNTTVRNAQQQASVINYHDSGLVESAIDFAGGFTALEFDESLHVRRLSFNGTAIAGAEYENGRLAKLDRFDSDNVGEQRFYYDPRGRLTRVVKDRDEVVAEYVYDDFGHVVYAQDSSTGYSASYGSRGRSERRSESVGSSPGTARRYRFDVRGDLRGVSMNGMNLRFDVDRSGMVEYVTWGEDKALEIAYAENDRVRVLRFDVNDTSVAAEYEYDDGGFRVSGNYDALQALGDTEVAFDYDSTGNLIQLDLPGLDGTRQVIRHTIGPENQLLLLTPVGDETFEQAIEYDESGRATRSVLGDGLREAVFRYDELGRLTDVYLDGEHVLTSSLGPMDLDPVHASDDYSAFTASGEPVASGIFGSLDEIVYTRSFGTPYGIARFVPEMSRFIILDGPVVPPDSQLIASLRRRNLASERTLNPSPLLGFDKPSSSLFVPPEFFTSNCAGCVGGATGFDLNRVGSGTVLAGQTITFSANATYAYCYYWYLDGYDVVTVPNAFLHQVSFLGDGGSGSGTYGTFTVGKTFSGSYSVPGMKTIRDTLECSCGNIWLAEAEKNIDVYYQLDIVEYEGP